MYKTALYYAKNDTILDVIKIKKIQLKDMKEKSKKQTLKLMKISLKGLVITICLFFLLGCILCSCSFMDEKIAEGTTEASGDASEVGSQDSSTTDSERFHLYYEELNYVVFVENMEDVKRGENLNYSNCYSTDIVRGGNHYWIDEAQTLWGNGTSEYGQLGELKRDLSIATEPKKLAENVKHVDYSGEYFVIYITENNELYGFGGNPAGILQEASINDWNSAYMHDMNVITEPVLLMEDVVFAKCGYSCIIAMQSNGDVYVMGNNDYAPDYQTYCPPEKVMENAKYVTAYYHTFAVICNDNSLWTWGNNRVGQCGVGSFSFVDTPQKVMDDVDCVWMGKVAFNYANVVSEQDSLIVLTKDGTFYGCGGDIGTDFIYDVNEDYDEYHMQQAPQIRASNVFQEIQIRQYEEVSLKSVELSWTKEEVRQFLESNYVDYYTGRDDREYIIANDNAWEFIFDDNDELELLSSNISDEFEKNVLSAGDTLQTVIEEYGNDYMQNGGAYDYYSVEYDMGDYIFTVGLYEDRGCASFCKYKKVRK